MPDEHTDKNQLEIPNTSPTLKSYREEREFEATQPGLRSEFQASLVRSSQPPRLHLIERAGEVLTLKASSKMRCRVKTFDVIWIDYLGGHCNSPIVLRAFYSVAYDGIILQLCY